MTATLTYFEEEAAPHGKGLRRVALLLAVATFPLIFMGGLVTSHSAGLSVPDWPNSFGYNMFLFPPNQWVGGILYEHTHRLMGTVVGFLSIILAAWAYGPGRRLGVRQAALLIGLACLGSAVLLGLGLWLGSRFGHYAIELRAGGAVGVLLLLIVALVAAVVWTARRREPRRWVRRLCLAVLGAVIFQGMLGGLRVVRLNLDLAVVHGCFAQAFFCLAAFTAMATSRRWAENPDFSAVADALAGRRVARVALLAVVVVYGQLVVGAIQRHYRAGLAIPDFPLAYGHVLPPTSEAQLRAALPPANADGSVAQPGYGSPDALYSRWMNRWPAWSFDTEELTVGKVWLHFGHRIGALLVSIVLLWLVASVAQLHEGRRRLARPSFLLLLLLGTQLTLGVLTVLLRKPADVASAHVAVGALVLVTSFVVAVRSIKLYGLRPVRRPSRVADQGPEVVANPALVA